MKVSVLLPGNSANTVCLMSEKGKVAREQQVVRQAGVRGNLQLLCNWSKAARTNLVPRVLWLFGQRVGASRDSGELKKNEIF